MQPTSVAAFLENMVKDSKRRLAIAITIVFPHSTHCSPSSNKGGFKKKKYGKLDMKNSKYVMLGVGSSGTVGNSVEF